MKFEKYFTNKSYHGLEFNFSTFPELSRLPALKGDMFHSREAIKVTTSTIIITIIDVVPTKENVINR